MGTVTNLDRFRKQKARADKRAEADGNAVKFGRTKAEKQATERTREKADKDLDGHKRDK